MRVQPLTRQEEGSHAASGDRLHEQVLLLPACRLRNVARARTALCTAEHQGRGAERRLWLVSAPPGQPGPSDPAAGGDDGDLFCLPLASQRPAASRAEQLAGGKARHASAFRSASEEKMLVHRVSSFSLSLSAQERPCSPPRLHAVFPAARRTKPGSRSQSACPAAAWGRRGRPCGSWLGCQRGGAVCRGAPQAATSAGRRLRGGLGIHPQYVIVYSVAFSSLC